MIPERPFYFLRHGRTDWEPRRALSGVLRHSTERDGIAQAHEAAEYTFASLSTARLPELSLLRAGLRTVRRVCRKQLGQRCNDTVGPYVSISGQPLARCVEPDCKDPQPLRCRDLPFQVVTNHPRISCIDSKLAQSMQVCSLVGLSKRVLAFDLDMVETIRKVEPVDLGSLRLGCSIGHKREARAVRPQRLYDVVSVREQAHVLIAIGGKPVGNPLGKPGGGHEASRARQRCKRSSDDLTPRIRQPHAPAAMPLSIGPEVPGECAYG